MKQTARLENWCLLCGRLHGEVYGHPLFPDGTTVSTGMVQQISDDRSTAETQNTVYELGKGYSRSTA